MTTRFDPDIPIRRLPLSPRAKSALSGFDTLRDVAAIGYAEFRNLRMIGNTKNGRIGKTHDEVVAAIDRAGLKFALRDSPRPSHNRN